MDERVYIDHVLRFIPVTPHFVTPDPETFLQDFDDLTWKHDEPVGSLSQYAGYCVARLTRQAGVPVTLNGHGGDEVLSGYWQCYFVHLRRMARQLQVLKLGAHLGGALLPGGNSQLISQAPAMLRRYGARRSASDSNGPVKQVETLGARQWRVYEIRKMTLPRLLKWDDRNFMSFSVEGRYPFLDHTLIELCLSFASDTLYDRGWTKEPMRLGMEGLLPHEILRRKSKIGFEPPQGKWLINQLKPLAQSILAADSPIWHFADRSAGQALVARVEQSQASSREDHQLLMRMLCADRWLRRFQLA
jgi:asparagine synthase (glutamine-hydrolysing)